MQEETETSTSEPAPSLLHLAVLGMAAGQSPSTRRRVYALVQEHPGLHQRELARRLELRPSHAEYHLRQLETAGLLRSEERGGYRRYFVAVEPAKPIPEGAVPREDRAWVGLLREARPLEIVARLLQEEPRQMGPLAEDLAIATSTLSYHVDKLEDAGIVERYRDGNQRLIRLVDRERLIRVLLQHEPPDDLVSGFRDLWDDLGL